MKTLVIGYGNRSRNDDGVGWFVVEWLEEMGLPGVELLTAHQLEVDFAETASQFDAVIFVDAAIPETPHLITRRVVRPSFQSHAVAHFLTPADVLGLSQTLYGRTPHGVLFSIRGRDFNFGMSLSPEVSEAAREVVRQIAKLVPMLSNHSSSKPKGSILKQTIAILAGMMVACSAPAMTCVECHKTVTPSVVTDWQQSRHATEDVDCAACHGGDHMTTNDVARAHIPTPETCAACHDKQFDQFKAGKHAAAWAAMKAMPTFHWQPMAMTEGMKGCGGCHKVGLKSEDEIKVLKKDGGAGFGVASCDVCHTRHTFSKIEAQQPQACQTCHMGFDHPQWEMYSASKHGVRALLKQNKTLPDTVAAPTCQTCHMQAGNHEVSTAWGFLAVRLPMPDDKQWTADRATILQALGVLDPEGKPTGRLDVVKAANVARLDQDSWQKERDKMIKTCNQCHSSNFAKCELAKGDDMIRQADHLMAEAIRTVAGLYKDDVLSKPKGYAYPFPDLLTFHDAPTMIEQKLFVMFLEHRMRAFQGTFHANPDYALWYGWSEMPRDLTEINTLAQELREKAASSKK